MEIIVFIILIFNISLDAFVIMMEKGATMLRISLKNAIVHSIIFSSINTGMFVLGHVIASKIFKGSLSRINSALLIIIFLIIGFKIIVETVRKSHFEEKLDTNFNYCVSAKNAVLAGIDCFLIALGEYYIDINIFNQLFIVFALTFCVVFCAMYIGYRQGAAYQKSLRYFCGIIYIGLAMIMILKLV